MDVKLVPIPRDALEQTVAVWLPFVQRIADRAKDHPGHLIEKISAGEIHIIVAWNPEAKQAEALCGLRLILRGDEKVAEIVWLTGKGRELWTPLFPDLEEYARDHLGCIALQAVARPGWQRTLTERGYKMTHVVMERAL